MPKWKLLNEHALKSPLLNRLQRSLACQLLTHKIFAVSVCTTYPTLFDISLLLDLNFIFTMPISYGSCSTHPNISHSCNEVAQGICSRFWTRTNDPDRVWVVAAFQRWESLMSCPKPVVFSALLTEGLSMTFWPSVRAVCVYGVLGMGPCASHVLWVQHGCQIYAKTCETSCEEWKNTPISHDALLKP